MYQRSDSLMEKEKRKEIEAIVNDLSGKLEECILREQYETASIIEPFVIRFRKVLPATENLE